MECGMSSDNCISNARIVTRDGIVNGSVLLRDGKIAAIDEGTARIGHDLDGDYLLPGFVELHTDHLESHFLPRPGVEWPAINAVIAHDAQIAASGITTVLDSLRVG
jgi:alpha-D-ribose 1-methylphosphonate 5-triphosphate diphosphatase